MVKECEMDIRPKTECGWVGLPKKLSVWASCKERPVKRLKPFSNFKNMHKESILDGHGLKVGF